MTISIDGTIDEVMQVLSTLGAASASSSSGLILGELATIEGRDQQMADVLDKILANESAEDAGIEQVSAVLTKLNADLAALKAGTISSSDPRFQSILDQQQKAVDVLKVLTQNQQAPASGDTTPPAGSGDAGSTPTPPEPGS